MDERKIKLKELREATNKTQEEIAKLLEMHTTQYCRYEREESELKTSIIIKICKLYKVSADYLLGLKE